MTREELGSSRNHDLSVIADEMKLYFEEVRDINARTVSYVKMLGVVVAAVLSYMVFAVRFGSSPGFLATTQPSATHYGAITKGYALIGIPLAFLLAFLLYVAVERYGVSRRHKTAYWRTIAILREHLHRPLVPNGGRAVPLQTGLERQGQRRYSGTPPKPVLRRDEYFFGGFLSTVGFVIFAAPYWFFCSVLDYGWSGFPTLGVSLGRGLCMAIPMLCIVATQYINLAGHFSKTIKEAQFVCPELREPVLRERRPSRGEKGAVRVLRVSWLSLVVYQVVVITGIRENHLRVWAVVGVLTFLCVCCERVLSVLLRQWSVNAIAYGLIRRIARLIGVKQGRHVDKVLICLLGSHRARRLAREARSCATVRLKPPVTDWPGVMDGGTKKGAEDEEAGDVI